MPVAVPDLTSVLSRRDMGGRHPQHPGGSTSEVSRRRQEVSRVKRAPGTNRQVAETAGMLVSLLSASQGGMLTLLWQRLAAAGSLSQILQCSRCRQSRQSPSPQPAGRPQLSRTPLSWRSVPYRPSKRMLRNPAAAANDSKQPGSRTADGPILRAAHLPLQSLQKHLASGHQVQCRRRLP